jgi:hypothetical protein
MNQDEKLDEALKGTFPASDAFYLVASRGQSRTEGSGRRRCSLSQPASRFRPEPARIGG